MGRGQDAKVLRYGLVLRRGEMPSCKGAEGELLPKSTTAEGGAPGHPCVDRVRGDEVGAVGNPALRLYCLQKRRRPDGEHARVLLPELAVETAAGLGPSETTPLLEEERDVRGPALVSYRASPFCAHGPRARPGLTADNHPVDAFER